MRALLLAVGVLTAGVLAAVVLLRRDLPLPPIAPDVEPICRDAMRRSPADLSWVAPNRGQGKAEVVTLGELRARHGRFVRVAGVLHVEFEWQALYASRRAMEADAFDGVWVDLTPLWPAGASPRPQGWPSISDRCAAVEGRYLPGRGGHLGAFKGEIRATRLDVWSSPHRPYTATPTPPPPPPVR